MARKATVMVQLKLRFSEALRRRLEREAARNKRSMNTEIIHRLEESLGDQAQAAMFTTAIMQMNRLLARGDEEGASRVVRKAEEERRKILDRLARKQPATDKEEDSK
jgi:biopolymer transport protein ExbB/TolQ